MQILFIAAIERYIKKKKEREKKVDRKINILMDIK